MVNLDVDGFRVAVGTLLTEIELLGDDVVGERQEAASPFVEDVYCVFQTFEESWIRRIRLKDFSGQDQDRDVGRLSGIDSLPAEFGGPQLFSGGAVEGEAWAVDAPVVEKKFHDARTGQTRRNRRLNVRQQQPAFAIAEHEYVPQILDRRQLVFE